MSTKELLVREAEAMPEPLLQEVLDFLRFLRYSRLPKAEGDGDHESLWGKVNLGRTALADAWDDTAEDEAWQDL